MTDKSITLFFVDDDELILSGIKRSLRNLTDSWAIEYFTEPAKALEKLKEKPAAIVVSDWQMPVIDGLKLCSLAKQELGYEGRFLYFILLTVTSYQDDVVRALESGIDDYLIKPVDMRELAARIRIGARLMEAERKLYDANRQLQLLATTDPLTGLLNRRAGLEQLEKEFARFRRGKQELSLLMLDIDHFKQINDNYGHNVGDAVLVELAVRLKSSLRNYDSIIRWGGEEFLIVCPHTSSNEVLPAAERVHRNISDPVFELESGLSLKITVSIGAGSTDTANDKSIND